ncbi:MAG: alpha/beta hydrolase, partial [Dehalococcoidia bacterium]
QYDEQLRTTPAEACLADSENCASYDLEVELHKIDLPALVVCGDEEKWIDGSRTIHARLPNSTFEIVPAAGHAIMVEQPDRLNAAIGSYLATLS